ncbi:hypothetical protein BDB01DRAFT_801851 [Pilobolus umbonatus]|nr:hypothetical protein BDB01DRAFT_801851 [Pilobolus umbonatus]
MPPITLKLKGNKHPFSRIESTDDLRKTWRLCTKVKDALENGSRLENLSWRLWYAHNVNNKVTSLRDFKVPEQIDFEAQKKQRAESFILPQFTSDQAVNEVVQLDDILLYDYFDPSWGLGFNPMVDDALYVSSESMPPLPIGTLHNKLLATLPRETLESAERLLYDEPYYSDHTQIPSMYQQQPEIQSIHSMPVSPIHSMPVSPIHSMPVSPIHSMSVPASPSSYMPASIVSSSMPVSMTASMPASRSNSPPHSPIFINQSHHSSHEEDKSIAMCTNCNTTSTPLWRRSTQDELLCNACGLYLKLHNIPRPKNLKPPITKSDQEDTPFQTTCSNCATSITPLWRRDINGDPLCNACGL